MFHLWAAGSCSRKANAQILQFWHGDAVTRHVFVTYQLVWLQILPKYGKINVLKAVFDISGFQEKGMGLFLWPARKILGAEVACEHFLPVTLRMASQRYLTSPLGAIHSLVWGPECTSVACVTGRRPSMTVMLPNVPNLIKSRRLKPAAIICFSCLDLTARHTQAHGLMYWVIRGT